MTDALNNNMEKANKAFNEVNFTVFENGANLIKQLLEIQNPVPEVEHEIERKIEYEVQDMTTLYNMLEKNNYKDIDGLKKTIKGLMKQINSNENVKNYIEDDILKEFELRGN